MKPDYKAYFKNRFKPNSNIIKSEKTGCSYVELNSKKHMIIERCINAVLLITGVIMVGIGDKDNIWAIVIVFTILYLAFIFLWPIILYKISRFEVIDEKNSKKK